MANIIPNPIKIGPWVWRAQHCTYDRRDPKTSFLG